MSSLYEFDNALRRRGFSLIAGVDEAGRGCLAGPVVAASVVLPGDLEIQGIGDSKTLSVCTRERLFKEIKRHSLAVGIGIVGPEEIDRINIYNATVEAMVLSLRRLRVVPDLVVVDALKLPVRENQLSLIKADSRSAVVAAASVVAKVVRDRIMKAIHRRYPQYGFDRNKGYATREHLKSLDRFGPCPVHRRSFGPVSQMQLGL